MTTGRRLSDLKLDAAYEQCTADRAPPGEEFLLRLSRPAQTQARRHLRRLRLHAPRRRHLRRRVSSHASSAAPISTRGSTPGIAPLPASRLTTPSSSPSTTPASASTSLSTCSTSSSTAPPWTSTLAPPKKPLRTAPRNPVRTTTTTTYATFDDLRRYCYYVASVVGLVCIRIFGYTDPRAEKLAEETGLAFQLTNILRDVREDAERGRIYLPLDDLDRYGVRIEDLAALRDGSRLTLNQRELLESLANRAEDCYKSGYQLLPLIDADSRPALWVLVTIYHYLLRRIERRNFDVFSERVRVPRSTRLSILFRGLLQVFRNRLTGTSRHA